jgi:hypothetical protein
MTAPAKTLAFPTYRGRWATGKLLCCRCFFEWLGVWPHDQAGSPKCPECGALEDMVIADPNRSDAAALGCST